MILVAVVPTHNEANNLPQLIEHLMALELAGVELRLLVVDDASPDGTGELAEDLGRRWPGRIAVLHRTSKRGLGSAYLDGFRSALNEGANLVLQMDADLSHPLDALPAMLQSSHTADVVVGSRYLDGGSVDRRWGTHRKFLSWAANRAVVPALLSLPMTDATSGYRLWQAPALAAILSTTNVQYDGYGFQVEMAYLAHQLGYRIAEVPIYFRERESGRSKMTLLVKLAAIRDILALRRRPVLSSARRREPRP